MDPSRLSKLQEGVSSLAGTRTNQEVSFESVLGRPISSPLLLDSTRTEKSFSWVCQLALLLPLTAQHHLPPQPACWCLCYFPTASAVLKMITDQCDLEADKGVRVSWSGSPCWYPRGPSGCGSHGCLTGCMNPCSLPQTSFPGCGLHDSGW